LVFERGLDGARRKIIIIVVVILVVGVAAFADPQTPAR